MDVLKSSFLFLSDNSPHLLLWPLQAEAVHGGTNDWGSPGFPFLDISVQEKRTPLLLSVLYLTLWLAVQLNHMAGKEGFPNRKSGAVWTSVTDCCVHPWHPADGGGGESGLGTDGWEWDVFSPAHTPWAVASALPWVCGSLHCKIVSWELISRYPCLGWGGPRVQGRWY